MAFSMINSSGGGDDNLETFSVLWLDAEMNNEENLAAQNQLRSIINQLRTFEDPDEFEKCIQCLSQGDRTVLIVSGRMGRRVVPNIHQFRQVSSIYVDRMNKYENEDWAKQYTKVKAVCTQLDELIAQIKIDQKRRRKLEEPLSLNIFSTNGSAELSSTGLNGQFLHSQILIDVLLRLKPNEVDRKELISLCKKTYERNNAQLAFVYEFEHDYRSSNAIWWYTRDSFLYKMLNKALRIQNVDVLFLLRSVIDDIRRQLSQYQCKSCVRVYRGQLMSKDELDMLRQSIGDFISMNSFLSTSIDRDLALAFLGIDNNNSSETFNDGLERVLFEIIADPRHGTMNRPFADTSELSAISEESEVLFMLGSIFRLNEICHDRCQPGDDYNDDNGRFSIIRMTWCGDHEHDLTQLYDHMKKELREEATTTILSLGQALRKMGKFDLAEKYFRRLLEELPSNDPSLVHLYHELGSVTDVKGEFDMSLECYQKSLEMQMRTHPSDYVNIANTHNGIGAVHSKKGDHSRALESYNRAVLLFKEAHDENHPDMAMLYYNIGIIYWQQKSYSDALVFNEKSLAIRQKHLPADHPLLGSSYNNIGEVHRALGHYDLALEYYNRSLQIYFKSLHPQHPNIASTYENIGLLYEAKDELEQALLFLQKASTIYHHSLPSQHPRVIKIEQNIQRVTNKLPSK